MTNKIYKDFLKGVNLKLTLRFVTLALILVFFMSCFITTLHAQTDVPFSQEKAIEMVKKIFDTSIYDNFNISYDEGRQQKTWNLHWSKSKEPYGSLSATIDAEKGAIVSINLYKGTDSDSKPSLVPKFSEDEAQKVAEDFAKKLQPEEFSKTVLRKSEEPPYYPLTTRYRTTYTFNFVRVVNDIPVEDNGFNIAVNANTGDIQRYNFSWSADELPSSEKIISQQDAEKIFTDKRGLQLVYKRYYDFSSKETQVKLVYTIDRPYEVLIDATSGELLHESGYYRLSSDGAGAAEKSMAQELTPEELREVEATKNCITKGEAAKIVEKYVEIPKSYEQRYANLYEDYDNPGNKIWSISWEKKKESDEGYGSIYARVDATSSDLLSFNIYDESMQKQDFVQKYDRSAAQKKAEQFLKIIQPEKLDNVKLKELPGEMEYPEKMRTHSYDYIRQVNDIPYTANGFRIEVDSESGKITSYNMTWHDAKFVEPDGILTKDKVDTRFLKDFGLELSYVRIYDNKDDLYKYYLVYKLAQSPSYTFDAFEFRPLDSRGNPIEEIVETSFTDIKDHWAENEIQLLVDLGIINSKQDTFNPNGNISQGRFVKLLLISTNNAISEGSSGSSPDFDDEEDIDEYLDKAVKLGIVKKGEVDPDKNLTREKMAAFIIRSLGFDKVASIHGIYNVPAKDKTSISPDYKGHAALSMGLGIVKGESGNFYPKDSVNRAQSAVVITRMLQLEN